MTIPIAKIALIGLGGTTTASGAYLMFKPDHNSEETKFSRFYDSTRDSLISEADSKELKQMEMDVQKENEKNQSRFINATLWLLEKENYKTISKEIADIVNKREPWGENVKKFKNKLEELVKEVQKDKEASRESGFSEDRIVAKALSADLENMSTKIEDLRKYCGSSANFSKTIDCNLEDLFLPIDKLLKGWRIENQGDLRDKMNSSEQSTSEVN